MQEQLNNAIKSQQRKTNREGPFKIKNKNINEPGVEDNINNNNDEGIPPPGLTRSRRGDDLRTAKV